VPAAQGRPPVGLVSPRRDRGPDVGAGPTSGAPPPSRLERTDGKPQIYTDVPRLPSAASMGGRGFLGVERGRSTGAGIRRRPARGRRSGRRSPSRAVPRGRP
jgi:hypothetical protein